jgi:dimethylglycine dehydrogenase
MCTSKVGMLDMSAFSKFIVEGPGAEAWLESLVANRVPKRDGRIALCTCWRTTAGYAPNSRSIARGRNPSTWFPPAPRSVTTSTICAKCVPVTAASTCQKVTTQFGVLVIAGPDSRKPAAKLTDADLSNRAFPWLTGQHISVGWARLLAVRVNFVGELGFEFHHPIETQNYLFDLLTEAGKEFDLKPFGIRAMDSMRLEKSYRLIPRELSIEYAALESGSGSIRAPRQGRGFHRQAGAVAVARAGFR